MPPPSPTMNVSSVLPLSISNAVSRLRGEYEVGTTRSLEWRGAQLRGLVRLLQDAKAEILAALQADLGKGEAEALTSEIGFVKAEAEHALRHLPKWMRPERVKTAWLAQPGQSFVIREPLGVVLILGTWNFPIQLMLGPLVSALAAGNVAVLKPSELAPETSALLAKLVPLYLDPSGIAVIEGGKAEATLLLEERFDHIFYTGNARVGRLVMTAAARHLTPVTLELGGKNPAIVGASADLAVAARRIAWGRFMNAGQVCIAPDYVLVERSIRDAFIDTIRSAIRAFYGDDPRHSPDYGRIVNALHHDRLRGLLACGSIVHGGRLDREQLYFEPTVLVDVEPTSPVMQEEIFGPILPVLPVDDLRSAIKLVNARPKPLAVYVFARDHAVTDRVQATTSSGALVINDVIANHLCPGLPFGGVGESGMGASHGRHGFEAMSHRKAVLRRSTWLDWSMRYPPYTAGKLKALRRFI
jgi:aldehyde dehydrogenase (NAD+)